MFKLCFFPNSSYFSLNLSSTNSHIVCFCLFVFRFLWPDLTIIVRNCSLNVFFCLFYVASLFKSPWQKYGCLFMFLKWMQWIAIFIFQPFKKFVKERNNAEQRTKSHFESDSQFGCSTAASHLTSFSFFNLQNVDNNLPHRCVWETEGPCLKYRVYHHI